MDKMDKIIMDNYMDMESKLQQVLQIIHLTLQYVYLVFSVILWRR